eukprot:TRINITY_DN3963_c0_g1_i1.p1 TRINITY_DN3963_c0_g1~~TRINITY_DN3963_c0_g1_i1.p1  ORF type:complete len:132 (-),score=25.45 TRINITY_DN3963_c0_g1_i1:65-460(-)
MRKTMYVLLFAAVSHAAVLGADNNAQGGSDGPSGCCDWPSCYDERTGLCLDTCLNTWTQCPAKLFLMNCYSQYLSPFGELPLQCFPDASPHLQEAEELGLTGPPAKIRAELHKLNAKNCHPRTGICRPVIP